jgi:hypothetical protein
MQIKGLHKNIYKFYAYARTHECLDVYRQEIPTYGTMLAKACL